MCWGSKSRAVSQEQLYAGNCSVSPWDAFSVFQKALWNKSFSYNLDTVACDIPGCFLLHQNVIEAKGEKNNPVAGYEHVHILTLRKLKQED